MTHEEWKEARQGVKRYMSVPGWALLIYYFIMNASVIGFMVMNVVIRLLQGVIDGDSVSIENAVMQASESAWGYFFAAAIGFAILLIWKKPCFLKEEIFAKKASMNAREFFSILCIFIRNWKKKSVIKTIWQLCLPLTSLLKEKWIYVYSSKFR